MWTAEDLARFFHQTYEALAPHHGYETRESTRVEWDDVPEPNKSLMIAVAGQVLDAMEQDGLFDPQTITAELHELEVSAVEVGEESIRRIAKAVAEEVRPAWVER